MPTLHTKIDFALGAELQRGLPAVHAGAVEVAAGRQARRGDGDAAGNASAKPRAVRRSGGKAAGRGGYAAARVRATDKAKALNAHEWRAWLLRNCGDGTPGYEAGKRGYLAHVAGDSADYDDFCRELARRCGV